MKRLAIPFLACTLVACAGAGYRPLVDAKGVNMANYEGDLLECQSYARQVAGAPETAAIGAIAGALIGAALSAAAGSRYDNHAAARVGAVAGGLGGAGSGETSQRDVIKNCMAGRGYRVLQ